ncbi:MAG: IS3 family transposase [Actinomycetota bacterium]
MSRYRWIDDRGAEGFEAAAAIKTAEVSVSAYYEWSAAHRGGATDAEWSEAVLVNEIVSIHAAHDDVGSPRMTRALHRAGHQVNHKKVERLMRCNGIYAIDGRRAKVRTTIPDVSAPPVPDLVRRDFSVGEQDLRWAGDITYIPTGEGWLYLSGVLDLGSRRVIGYDMAERMPTALVIGSLEMAINARGGDVAGVIFHADRGTQYLSHEQREFCEHNGILRSVGRTGSCLDNAVAESFWATLKRELVHRRSFATRAEARRAIIGWINYYNAARLHSSLGYLTPIEWELQQLRRMQEAA